MNNYLLWLVAASVSTASLLRWLRISQREHYLPGAVVKTAQRWLVCRPPNALFCTGWALAVLAATVAYLSHRSNLAAVLGVLAAFCGLTIPLGLPVLGTVRLRFTRRAATHLAIAWTIDLALMSLTQLLAGPVLLASSSAPLGAIAIEFAALMNAPLERRMAERFRRQASSVLGRTKPKVIAITGSYGKTTVKNHLRDLLAGSFETVATPASWNNMSGISRAINETLTPTTEYFVAEIGTYGVGEINAIVSWLKPDISAIVALGPVHLERMRDIDTVLRAKSEILLGAEVAVICTDNPLLDQLAKDIANKNHVKLWTAGSDASRSDVDVVASLSTSGLPPADQGADDVIVVRLEGYEVGRVARQQLHPSNVACAVALALAAGLEERVLSSVLSELSTPPSRAALSISGAGIIVVDDTYNSNPSGAQSALEMLCRVAPLGRRVVITPGMVELGSEQAGANKVFAEAIGAAGAELVIVGWTNRRALLAGLPGAQSVSDRNAARQWVRRQLTRGDGVLWENDLPDHYP